MHTPIYLPRQADLLNNVKKDILSGNKVRLQAKGWSMLPFIWNERDILILAPLSEEPLSVGQIVFAQTGSGRYVVHRISRIVGTRIELRGDGNPYQEEYVHPATVFGELIGIERNGRLINKGDFLWKFAEIAWPNSSILRRILLFFYRTLVIRKNREEMRVR